MATNFGSASRFCDGMTRRVLLKVGSLALGGLTLPDLLRAEAASGSGKSQKSVIMVFLSGGPPHQDMVDLKPHAPVEYRGEFQPISTNVPGIEICELLPQLAQRADRLAVIRSLVGSEGRHAAFQCLTGQPITQQPPGGWPSLGSVVSKLRGPAAVGVPPFVSLSPRMKIRTWSDPGQPGFVGQAHAAFAPNAEQASLKLQNVTVDKLLTRQALLSQLDGLKRDAATNDALAGADSFYQQAFGILTSSRLANALDLSQEAPQVRDRYGRGSLDMAGYGDAGPIMNDYFLAARRLIEAGVRVVTLAYGRWDWHGRPHGTNFENARDHLPIFDQGLSALLDDLAERGMTDDVTVLVWGEFGRTPRINKNGGGDHWPQVACALLSGGGMRTGQVIGSTNRLAEVPKDRPVHFQEVFATLYHNLGIGTDHLTLNDLSGRPQYLIDSGRFPRIRGADLMAERLLELKIARTVTHGNAAYWTSFSPDGKRLATASLDNTVKLWGVADGAHLGTLTGHGDGVAFVDFLKDGRIVTGSLDRTLKIWSADQKLLTTLTGHQDYLTSAAISRSGTLLASGSLDKTVRVWDAETGLAVAVFSGHDAAVQTVAIAPGDRLVASAGDDFSIRLWDVEGRKLERVLPAHSAAIEAVVFSPNKNRFASGAADGRIKLWNGDGALLADVASRSPRIKSLAFSPDGEFLASGASDGVVRLWRAADLREAAAATGHRNTVYGVAFSPDGQMLASASFDRKIHVWTIASR